MPDPTTETAAAPKFRCAVDWKATAHDPEVSAETAPPFEREGQRLHESTQATGTAACREAEQAVRKYVADAMANVPECVPHLKALHVTVSVVPASLVALTPATPTE